MKRKRPQKFNPIKKSTPKPTPLPESETETETETEPEPEPEPEPQPQPQPLEQPQPPPKSTVNQPLQSTGKYPRSWLYRGLVLHQDLLLVLCWGPTIGWPDRSWFLHGGWKNLRRAGSRPYGTPLSDRDISPKVRARMRKIWPKITNKRHKGGQVHSFWSHQWQKHGRFFSVDSDDGKTFSMPHDDYFSTVIDLYEAVMKFGIDLEVGELIPKVVKEQLEAKFGHVQPKGFTGKTDENVYLNELLFFIDKASYTIKKNHINKNEFLGHIKKDGVIILPGEPVELRKTK